MYPCVNIGARCGSRYANMLAAHKIWNLGGCVIGGGRHYGHLDGVVFMAMASVRSMTVWDAFFSDSGASRHTIC
jgi:hypothetical protein